jgi:CheY-like chemotaxis protein
VENELDLIFEEFYQIDNAERDRSKGLGLGLSMVKRSCDLLNHPFQVKSHLGRGTQFSVLVPITQSTRNTPVGANDDLELSVGGIKDLHVMVIENDPLSSLAIAGLLSSWGCHVNVFHDADDACEGIKNIHMPSIIVSDYRLPGEKSGVDAIRAIREFCESSIPAVLVSGDKNEEFKSLASADGLVLLSKPLQPAKLRNLLRRI